MLNVYRTQATVPVDPAPASQWRILRVPYRSDSIVHHTGRYLVQKRTRFLFFWWRWKTLDWHFTLQIALKDLVRRRKPPTDPPLLLPTAVVWEEGCHPEPDTNGDLHPGD